MTAPIFKPKWLTFVVQALTHCAAGSPALQQSRRLKMQWWRYPYHCQENKAKNWGKFLKTTQQIEGKSKWRVRVCDFWSMGCFLWHSVPVWSGDRSQRQAASGLLSSMLVLSNQSSQKSQGPEERYASTNTPPTNMPIQLKLVLLKEVGCFTSRRITFMWSHHSLLEKWGN